MGKAKKQQHQSKVAKAEDVEYSNELADHEDKEARQRAKQADERAK